MLLSLVLAYLLVTIVVGLWAAKRVRTAADFAIAGRQLPLAMVITTTFATWFGSETVLGIPAKFISGGLHGVVEDPFGAGCCLILVGIFFAGKLYRMNLLTICDYFRERYGRRVEVACSVIIMLSYLGWVSAQVTALGLIFNLLSDGYISLTLGMTLGVISILAYTLFGGMWSVAITDFIQVVVLVIGLSIITLFASDLAGGVGEVISLAASRDLFRVLPEPQFTDIMFFIASAITMMFGSIPQQDVFQRVMSANSESAASRGPIIGGVCYIIFALVPMFLVTSALIVMPDITEDLLRVDPQRVLPTLVMEKMPFIMQVLFFGALLSAIKSTASATLLAPSVTFTENILSHFRQKMSDHDELHAMQMTVLVFSACVLCYAIYAQGSSIYEMVSGAYQITLVGAFVPLISGLYWQRATTQGAIASIALGLITWLFFLTTPMGELFPSQLAGLVAGILGMVTGSLAPQLIPHEKAPHRRHSGLE